MPIKKFDTQSAELHLGILQQQIQRLKGKKHQCAFILDEDNNLDRDGIDMETEKLNLKNYEQKEKEMEEALEAYENKCLELTQL
jgi:hypothetical protein